MLFNVVQWLEWPVALETLVQILQMTKLFSDNRGLDNQGYTCTSTKSTFGQKLDIKVQFFEFI